MCMLRKEMRKPKVLPLFYLKSLYKKIVHVQAVLFIVALLIIAKMYKESKYPLVEG